MENLLTQNNIADMYSLSPMQQGMLFHSVYGAGSTVYLEQLTAAVEGRIDTAAFERAWNKLIEANPVLRTVFRWRNLDAPAQVVLKRYPLQLTVVDLRAYAHDHEARRRASEEFLAEDRRTPLALETGPLMRVALLCYGERQAQLVWTFHHILFDGWSLPLLIGDLLAAYEAICAGGDFTPPPRRPFREYIAWLKRQDPQAALAFWSEQLHGFSAKTPLPLATRTAMRELGAVEEYSTTLEIALSQQLRTTARALRVTPNALFQCAWSILLSRLCAQSDVMHGITSSGRPVDLAGAENMVGQLTNTLPMRVRVDGAQPALALAQRVQELIVRMQQHEWIELPRLRSLTALKGDDSLFDTLFVFENYPVGGTSSGRSSLKLGMPQMAEATNFPLAIIAGPAGEAFSLRIEYAREVYDQATIARLAGHFRRLLDAIAERPGARIDELALLTAAEERQILLDWNATARDYPSGETIQSLFEGQAEKTPEGVALVFEGERLCYRELNARANQLAHHLRALGVGPDACVALCVERSTEMVVGLLGILKAGAAYLPLDPAYPQERLAYMLEDARPRVLLAQERLLALLPPLQVPVFCLDTDWGRLEHHAKANPQPLARPDNLAYLIYTSGSTGRPKGVMATHRGISNRLVWMQEQYQLTEADGVLQKTPFSFDVSVWEFFWPLMVGARLVMARPDGHKDSAYLASVIRAEHITTIHFVPSMLQAFVETPELETCTSLRRVICSGEALPPHLQNRFRARSRAELHNLYGPTEASVDVSYWHCAAPEESTVPIGRPIANTQLHILDPRLNPVPIGVAGELYIGGIGLARGYLKRPALTAERFIADPFSEAAGRLYRTGDLARWRPDGSIEYLGRNDFQVKIRGFRIELGEIEAALQAQPAVREATVMAREHAPGDKRLVAYLTARDGHTMDERALRTALKERLPEYMIPARFVVLEHIPLTVSGKVDRQALPAPEGERPTLQTHYEPPREGTEQLLATIWRQVLKLERVGRHDNFFDLGGDSILSLQIVARLHQHKLSATPKLVFEHQTIAELVPRLQQRAERAVRVPAEVAGEVVLTPIQHWFFEQPLAQPAHWNHALLLGSSMRLDAQAVERALQALLDHHDGLRLAYRRENEGWRQRNRPRGEAVALTVADLASHADPLGELARRGQTLHETLSLEHGPLLRAGLFRLGESADRLLLVIHHLVVDGVSWRILMEDLASAYSQALRGAEIVLPPKSDSFQAWGRALESYAQSRALQAEREYWYRTLSAPVERIEPEYPQAADRVADVAYVRITLSAERTGQLLGAARHAYHTEINELLLTAVLRALRRWRGIRSLLIDLEGHGREALFDGLDLSRTVGWFTSLFPVHLALADGDDLGRDICVVKEALRAVPNKGIGYGVLRYLARDQRLACASTASVGFNYLGQWHFGDAAGAWSPARESSGPPIAGQNTRSHSLMINALATEGVLAIDLMYGQARFERASLERLAEHLGEELERLVIHCLDPRHGAWTAADFPLARLTETELAAFPRDVEDAYGLAPLQQGLLFQALFEPESPAYFEQYAFEFSGIVDTVRLQQVWRSAIMQNPVLRTVFRWHHDGEPAQLVLREIPVPLEVHDLRGLEASDADSAMAAFREQDRRAPFDLARGPLFRLNLFMCRANRAVLLFSYHHIILDGWSLPILIGDVFRAYADAAAPALEVKRRPYREYIAWLQQQDKDAARAFWREHLRGLDGPTRLPMTRPTAGPSANATLVRPVSARLAARLQERARQERVALSAPFLAGWAVLLARYSGRQDVVFGVTTAGRPATLEGSEDMVGAFINTVPVRVGLRPSACMGDLLQPLQAHLLAAAENAHLSLAEIQHAAGFGGESPFDTIVVFENYPIAPAEAVAVSGLTLMGATAEDRTHYPLALAVVPQPRLELHALYRSDVLAARDVETLLDSYTTLLEAVADVPTRLLSDELTSTPIAEVERRSRARTLGAARSSLPTRSPLEELIAEIWADVLGVERVGADADFFALGGHSLLAIRAANRLSATLGRQVAVRALFEARTVAALARQIMETDATLPPVLERLAPRDYYPLSHSQRRIWFLMQLQGAESAYNIPAAVRLRGTLNHTLLAAALERLADRHAVLRTTFITVDGEPMQWPADEAKIPLALESVTGEDSGARLDHVRLKLLDFALEPFNLETGPLLRAKLFQLAADDHVFAFVVHHIVADGWSMDLLVRELCALYAELNAPDAAPPLSPLPVQYVDYAQWQRELLASGAFREQRDYWLQRLSGDLPALQLPTDRPRPAVHSFRGSRYTARSRARLLEALRRICAERGVTLFMLLLAAYQTLLARLCGQTEIVVGTPAAGRQHAHTENMVGLFLNMLALRADLSDNPRFVDLLERVRESCVQAYANQDYPFDLLVDELGAQRDLSRPAVFNTTFVLQMSAFAAPDPAPTAMLGVERVPFEYPQAKFDLGVAVIVEDEALAIEFEYNTDLFDRETIVRMGACYAQLLEGIAADPSRRIAALPLLDSAHREQVVRGFNGARARNTVEQDLGTRFRECAEGNAERIAVVCGEQSITYGELDRRSDQLAQHLVALGLPPEAPVAICLERSVEQITSILGVLKAGGCYLPIEPSYPDERVAYMVRDAACHLGIGLGPSAERLAAHVEHSVCVARDAMAIATHPTEQPARRPRADQLAYVIYTSGSTGRPKGTLLTHANVLRLFQACDTHFRFDEQDVWTLFHSYCFDFSVWEIFGALLYGGRLVVVPALIARSPHELMRLLEQQGVTVLSQTPSAFLRLLDGAGVSGQWGWSAALRYVVFGGEALEYAALRPWYQRRKNAATALINMYGITETTVHVTYREGAEADVNTTLGRRVGRPLADLTTYILDTHGEPQPIGVAGELHVGGAGLGRGYLGQPALTAQRFVPDPFGTSPGARLYRTGDLARFHGAGEIEYLGRIDQQVKIRGYRIEPGEIEAALLQHDSITGALVIAAKDRGHWENLLAYYCAPEALTTSALRAFLGRSLPDYMIPFAFVHLREFPLTANGKIDRSKLAQVHGERPQLDVPYLAPRSVVERKLAEIWCEVLGIERVGVRDNFFDLGGESFSAYRLLTRISEEFGKELPLAAIFQAQTVERLAERVAEALDSHAERALIQLQAGAPERLPFFCVHPAGGDVLGFQDLARALGPDQPFYGLQSLVRFLEDQERASLEEMARHYVAEIRSVQPQGPYLLGGHSLGAVVAFEMARQLEQAGHEIGVLAIIDGGARIESSALLDTLLLVSDTFELGIQRSELVAVPEDEMMSYLLRKAKKRFSRVLEIAYDLDILPRGFRTRDAELFLRRIGSNLAMATRYRLPALRHGLDLFFATEQTENGKPVDVDLWRAAALGGVNVIKVPGTHVSLVKKPHVAVLAVRLRELLDRAHQSAAREITAGNREMV